jgi:hypothetical protein
MSPHFNPIISLTRSPVEAARKTIVWNGSCNSANCRKNFPPCSRPGPRTTLTKKWFSPKRKPFSVEASPCPLRRELHFLLEQFRDRRFCSDASSSHHTDDVGRQVS